MNANVIARKLGTLQKKGAMKATDVADALGIRPETVSRWNQGKAFPQPEAERALLDLEYIVDLLADLYQPNEARMIEVSEQVHDVFQIEKRPLSFGLRKRLTLIPARDGLRSNPQRISHISGLHRPFLLEGPEFSSNDIGVHSPTRMKSPSGSATGRITRGSS